MSDTPEPHSTPPSEDRPTRTATWVKVVLVLSLALNLLIAGVVMGAVAGKDRRGDPGRAAAPRDLAPLPFIIALPRESRQSLVESFREELRKSGPERERSELRQRVRALLSALRADPFDGGAVSALLSEQRASVTQRQDIGQRVLIRHLEAMTPDERATFAERLEKSIRRGQRP